VRGSPSIAGDRREIQLWFDVQRSTDNSYSDVRRVDVAYLIVDAGTQCIGFRLDHEGSNAVFSYTFIAVDVSPVVRRLQDLSRGDSANFRNSPVVDIQHPGRSSAASMQSGVALTFFSPGSLPMTFLRRESQTDVSTTSMLRARNKIRINTTERT
jgi:hypothetical protein